MLFLKQRAGVVSPLEPYVISHFVLLEVRAELQSWLLSMDDPLIQSDNILKSIIMGGLSLPEGEAFNTPQMAKCVLAYSSVGSYYAFQNSALWGQPSCFFWPKVS